MKFLTTQNDRCAPDMITGVYAVVCSRPALQVGQARTDTLTFSKAGYVGVHASHPGPDPTPAYTILWVP